MSLFGPKIAGKDFHERDLPSTRREVYFDVVHLHWSALLVCGVLLLAASAVFFVTGILESNLQINIHAMVEGGEMEQADAIVTLVNFRCLLAAADIIVSRAGAITISELCVVGKPVILVPSPNVAEDHQTKNAQALSAKNAAVLLTDDRVSQELGKTIVALYHDTRRRELLSQNISRMGTTTAARDIVDEVLKLAQIGRRQKENRKNK